MEVVPMTCRRFAGRVTAIAVDSQHSNRVLVVDEEGSIWVFNVENKRNCKVEHRFPRGATHAPVELASVRGFTLAFESTVEDPRRTSLVVLNMTHCGKKKGDPARTFSPVVWRRTVPVVKDWAVHK